MIADFHMTTGVSHGGECASACVLIWSAGEFKSAGSDSKIGVHMTKDMNGEPTVDGTILVSTGVRKPMLQVALS
jgi:hypothetical protein